MSRDPTGFALGRDVTAEAPPLAVGMWALAHSKSEGLPRHNLETRFNSPEKLAKKAGVISGTAAAELTARDKSPTEGTPIMKKTLLSALGLAIALAFAVPALGTTEANAAATAPAATTTTATTTAPASATETAKPTANGPHKKLRKHHRHHARKHHHVKKHHVRKHHVMKKHVAKKAA